MTDEMLALARENAESAPAPANVEFVKGHIEEIPLADASVDVVISNCVINLSADKQAVLREVARVLRPGGRFAVSDVIADPDMDEATRARHAAVDGLRRRRADRARNSRARWPPPASWTSRFARPTGCTSTPRRRSSAPSSPPPAARHGVESCCEPAAKADCCGEPQLAHRAAAARE